MRALAPWVTSYHCNSPLQGDAADKGNMDPQQRQQLRELLANKSKSNQSKKKKETERGQQEVISGSQMPLHHWPEEGSTTPQPFSGGEYNVQYRVCRFC